MDDRVNFGARRIGAKCTIRRWFCLVCDFSIPVVSWVSLSSIRFCCGSRGGLKSGVSSGGAGYRISLLFALVGGFSILIF